MNYQAELFRIAPDVITIITIMRKRNKDIPLKTLLRGREGQIRRNVQNPESIYEHSCKIGLAANYLLGTTNAIHMGISHDFPENEVRDIIPGEMDLNEKYSLEEKAMESITSELPNGEYWLNLWNNFENQEEGGEIVYQLDKICPAIQALNYIRNGNGDIEGLKEFYPYARSKITDTKLIGVLDTMYERPTHQTDAYEDYFALLETTIKEN